MPTQVGFAPRSYGIYNGFQAAPRYAGMSDIRKMAGRHRRRGATTQGPRLSLYRNRDPFGSSPANEGSWRRGTPFSRRPSVMPYVVSPSTPGRSRVRKRLRYDGDPMEYEGGGMYYGRGRYRRKGIYKKRRMRRY